MEMNKSKHTPGKLFVRGAQVPVGPNEEGDRLLHTEDKQHIAESFQYRNHEHTDAATAIANAERLAACWNACEGINPEAVKDLLEACRALVLEWNSCFEGQDTGYDGTPLHDCVMLASAAIAKAEGGDSK